MSRPIAAICAVTLLAACHAGERTGEAEAAPLTGVAATRDFALKGFDGVALRGSDDVSVAIGPAFAVRATGDRAVLDQLDIVVEGGTLKIGRKHDSDGWWREAGARSHARVAVTLPKLTAVTVAGSGDMKVGAVRGDAFDAAIAGSGDLDLAALTVVRAALSVAGSGDLNAAGAARDGTYSVAGSGNIRASALRADTLALSVAGSGDLAASARTSARVSILGSGDVTVTGGARCDVNKIGSGTVTCG